MGDVVEFRRKPENPRDEMRLQPEGGDIFDVPALHAWTERDGFWTLCIDNGPDPDNPNDQGFRAVAEGMTKRAVLALFDCIMRQRKFLDDPKNRE